MAGIGYSVTPTSEYITFTFVGYNDGLDNFILDFFKKMQDYSTDKEVYENFRKKKIRAYYNTLMSEPFQLFDNKINVAMLKYTHDIP